MDTHINGKSSAKAMNADAVQRGWIPKEMPLTHGIRESKTATNLEYIRISEVTSNES